MASMRRGVRAIAVPMARDASEKPSAGTNPGHTTSFDVTSPGRAAPAVLKSVVVEDGISPSPMPMAASAVAGPIRPQRVPGDAVAGSSSVVAGPNAPMRNRIE